MNTTFKQMQPRHIRLAQSFDKVQSVTDKALINSWCKNLTDADPAIPVHELEFANLERYLEINAKLKSPIGREEVERELRNQKAIEDELIDLPAKSPGKLAEKPLAPAKPILPNSEKPLKAVEPILPKNDKPLEAASLASISGTSKTLRNVKPA